MKLETDETLGRFSRIDELIGNEKWPTPMVRVKNFEANEKTELYLKLEWFNPFGSIKDRTAKFIIEGMLGRQDLDGKELVEPSSGNTGIALSALANLHGTRATITIPDAVPEEKQTLLRLLGATVWPTPDDVCPIDNPKDGAIALARAIASNPRTEGRYVMPNQYENPDNVKAHYETTGPEIWRQTGGEVRYFFCGFGTCGTITGVARYLKEQNPDVRVIAIEPEKGHRLPGLKNFEESKKPSILDESLIDDVVKVPDESAYETTIALAREEGLLVGPSTGAAVWAAQEFINRMEGDSNGIAVAISPDSALKYVSYLFDHVKNDGHPV